MLYKTQYVEINTNLAGDLFQKLNNGDWKLGLIKDNDGIDDNTDSSFYTSNGNYGRHFKNKVYVVLSDHSQVYAHIIHWDKPGGYFCVEFCEF